MEDYIGLIILGALICLVIIVYKIYGIFEEKNIARQKKIDLLQYEENKHFKAREDAIAKAEIEIRQRLDNARKAEREATFAKDSAKNAERQALNSLNAANDEKRRYALLREDLINRYNTANERITNEIKERSYELLNGIIETYMNTVDSNALAESLKNGRLETAFDGRLIISKLNISARVTSKNGTYETTLNTCTCKDFQMRKHPCKHILYLSHTIGLLQTLKLDPAHRDNMVDEINQLYVDLSGERNNVHQQLVYLTDRFNATKREIDARQRELVINFEKQEKALRLKLELLEKTVSKKENKYPNVIDFLCDSITGKYTDSEDYLLYKSNSAKKAAEIVSNLKKETRQYIKELSFLKLKLAYLEDLYPGISEVDQEINSIANFDFEFDETVDHVRHYLSDEEFAALSITERNQLALDRYVARPKTNWQIGRDYEMYIGHLLEDKGYKVIYTGITKKLEDMGRDLIAKKSKKTIIIQCKNWAKDKTIHEKHIFQLFGTVMLYKLDHQSETVKAVFISTTDYSDTATQIAAELNIELLKVPRGEYPRIKCNVNRESGEKIYHLPFDQQYDNVVIEKKHGECYAYTVAEAEAQGFRRAKRYYEFN